MATKKEDYLRSPLMCLLTRFRNVREASARQHWQANNRRVAPSCGGPALFTHLPLVTSQIGSKEGMCLAQKLMNSMVRPSLDLNPITCPARIES